MMPEVAILRVSLADQAQARKQALSNAARPFFPSTS